MDKIRRDKRKKVHARLDFEEGPRERRIREGSHYSSARTLSARPDRTSSKYRSRGRSRPHRRDSSNGDGPQSRDCSRDVGESYDNSHSSYRTGTTHGYRYHDRDRSLHVKRERDSESPLTRVSESGSSDGGHWKSKSKRHKPTDEDDLTMPWMCEEQKDGETIEDFMERFKVETKRMKGAPECMRISEFMHEVNNPELTKRLNEHVLKTMEEMMITTTAFIRGEAVAVGKKKVTHHGEHMTSQSDTLQGRGLTSEAAKGRKGGRDQSKVGKKEAPAKDKSMAIYMIQSWQRMTWQKVTQSFERVKEITFPLVATISGTEGPLVIEVEIGGHLIHRIETIWPLGQLKLLVTIGDADHSTRAWMNFMIVRSISPYNGIIRRHRIKEIQAIPSTAHGMLKFSADEGIVTIRSTILIPAECAMVITSAKEIPKDAGVRHENFKVALHPNFPDQEVAIGGTLSAKGRTELCSLLKENLDIFAWQ
nr:hypothetical protein [Tanacetum cinerariifolium]